VEDLLVGSDCRQFAEQEAAAAGRLFQFCNRLMFLKLVFQKVTYMSLFFSSIRIFLRLVGSNSLIVISPSLTAFTL
jgi:hypothetical protein